MLIILIGGILGSCSPVNSNEEKNVLFEVDSLNQLDTISYRLINLEDGTAIGKNCSTEETEYLKDLKLNARIISLNNKCIHEVNFDNDPFLEKLIYVEIQDKRRALMIFQEDGTYNILGLHQKDVGAIAIEDDLSWIETIEVLPKGEKIYKTEIDSTTGDILGIDSTSYFEIKHQGVQFGVEESGGGMILYWENDSYRWTYIE